MEAGTLFTGITCSFPNLVHDITYSVPIGNPPLLTHTFIPNNLKSADIDPVYMDKFIQEELDIGHFDGPFSVDEAHTIVGGHFCTASLSFVEKHSLTALHLIHHHSKDDLYGYSTNSWLYLTIYVTKIYTAADATDFVSIHLLHSLLYSPLQSPPFISNLVCYLWVSFHF